METQNGRPHFGNAMGLKVFNDYCLTNLCQDDFKIVPQLSRVA